LNREIPLSTVPMQEDLKSVQRSCEADDFENMNVFANRMMSNAVIESDRKFMLIGFLLKDSAIEMLQLRGAAKDGAISTAKSLVTRFAQNLDDLSRRADFDEEAMWNEYVDLSERIRRFHLLPVEEKAYSANREFTRKVANWMLDHLTSNQELLLEPKSRLLKGCLNEIGRAYRVHGADRREIVIFSLLTALDRVYSYARFAYLKGTELDTRRMQDTIFPYLDRISKVVSGEIQAKTVDDILCELIAKWREAFVNYMELREVSGMAVERGVQLPEETKKKITEAITSSLEPKEEKAKK
jgi:hypothetical protein